MNQQHPQEIVDFVQKMDDAGFADSLTMIPELALMMIKSPLLTVNEKMWTGVAEYQDDKISIKTMIKVCRYINRASLITIQVATTDLNVQLVHSFDVKGMPSEINPILKDIEF